MRRTHALDSIGDIITYAKQHNILGTLQLQNNNNLNTRGVILIYEGKVLNADNEFVAIDDSRDGEGHMVLSLPREFENFRAVLGEACQIAVDDNAKVTLARVVACIQECLKACKEGMLL